MRSDNLQRKDERIGRIAKAVEDEELEVHGGPADFIDGLARNMSL